MSPNIIVNDCNLSDFIHHRDTEGTENVLLLLIGRYDQEKSLAVFLICRLLPANLKIKSSANSASRAERVVKLILNNSAFNIT